MNLDLDLYISKCGFRVSVCIYLKTVELRNSSVGDFLWQKLGRFTRASRILIVRKIKQVINGEANT